MSFLSPKTLVEREEEDFNTKRMMNRKIYHELNIRSGDLELLRTQVLELVEDMSYDIIINKFTKFEDSEFNSIFEQGRLKPLRAVLNAEKRITTGSMFPWLWKLCLGLSIACFVLYFTPQSFFDNFNITIESNYFSIAGLLLLTASFLLWYTRRIDVLSIYFKASGIYNIEDKTSDFKVILSAESTSSKDDVMKKLDDEVAEIFTVISKKYVKETEKKTSILELSKKNKNLDTTVIKGINEVEDDLRNLDSRLATGEISEGTYREVKNELLERKRKLETILDLV